MTLMGTSNRHHQQGPDIPIIFLLHSWGFLFGVPITNRIARERCRLGAQQNLSPAAIREQANVTDKGFLSGKVVGGGVDPKLRVSRIRVLDLRFTFHDVGLRRI